MYNIPIVGGIPTFAPYQCLHCYHRVCLIDWRNYGSTKGDGEGCPNYCVLCKSIIADKYNNLYDYDWNMNGSAITSLVDKRNKLVIVLDSVARILSTVNVKEER